jgi:hypothetical protein
VKPNKDEIGLTTNRDHPCSFCENEHRCLSQRLACTVFESYLGSRVKNPTKIPSRAIFDRVI